MRTFAPCFASALLVRPVYLVRSSRTSIGSKETEETPSPLEERRNTVIISQPSEKVHFREFSL
jgi:hypothetical protein